MSGFREEITRLIENYENQFLSISSKLRYDVLAVYVEDQKYQKRLLEKLQHFYEKLKRNIEVDEKSGYHVRGDRRELLKIVEELLGEEKP